MSDDWRRAAYRRGIVPLVLAVAGIASFIVAPGTTGRLVGACLCSIAGVFAISLVFMEVGLSEDRQRARDEADREARLREAGPRHDERRLRPPRRSRRR